MTGPAVVGMLLLVLLVLVVLVGVVLSVKVVPQQHAFVVERLGRYLRTLGPGLNIVTPYVDRVRARFTLLPQRIELAPLRVTVADGTVVAVRPVIHFTVTDPVRATYEVASFHLSMEQLTATAVRNLLSGLDGYSALTARDELHSALLEVLGEAAEAWGLKISGIDVPQIERIQQPQ
ncbi:MAG TPA: SPFH domain-containing protein [Kribbellaceae bacterium]|nr:SPFH domain-containing protein [Kribbellaceae bacterium]